MHAPPAEHWSPYGLRIPYTLGLPAVLTKCAMQMVSLCHKLDHEWQTPAAILLF